MTTKQEFKKQFSHFRECEARFTAKMENGNFPCGYDDSLYENYQYHKEAYLKNKPELEAVIFSWNELDGAESYEVKNDVLREKLFCLNWLRG